MGQSPLCTPLCMGAPPQTPGDFLTKRKSPKIRQGPPGPWPPGEGGLAPFDPPAFCPSSIGCGQLNPQASSEAILPCHGLTAGSVSPMEPKEKTRPICLQTQSGKSVYFCGTNPIEGVRQRRRGDNVPPSGGPGAQPRHAFGSFRRETKGTPGVGRVGPPMGRSAEDGAPAPPRKKPPGAPAPTSSPRIRYP